MAKVNLMLTCSHAESGLGSSCSSFGTEPVAVVGAVVVWVVEGLVLG
jgi:hypothetical protein